MSCQMAEAASTRRKSRRRGHEPAVGRLLPLQLQVRHQPRHDHQVTPAFTGDLIGDLGPSGLGIQGWRHTASHTDMIHHPRRHLPGRTRSPLAEKKACAPDRRRRRPCGRLMRQIIPFGRDTGGHVGYQIPDHIGGYGASALPSPGHGPSQVRSSRPPLQASCGRIGPPPRSRQGGSAPACVRAGLVPSR